MVFKQNNGNRNNKLVAPTVYKTVQTVFAAKALRHSRKSWQLDSLLIKISSPSLSASSPEGVSQLNALKMSFKTISCKF